MLQTAIQSGQLVIYAAYALIGLGTFIVARMLLQEQEARAAQENLEELRNRKASSALVRVTRPFFGQYVVPIIRGKPFWEKQRLKYKRRIISAGLRDELTPDEFIAFKLVLILFFPLALGALRALGIYEFPLIVIGLSTVVGWFYPDIWVHMRVSDRQKKIRKAMPFIVDLLALSTEAGLDFVGAIGKVVEKAAPSPLVEEFGQVLRELRLGSSRSEALREMANRIDMAEVGSFIAILISADSTGASIGKILRQQSEQVRNQRFVMAEKAGAAAAQKILFPLMFLILPAVILMVLGPFILSFIYPGAAT